MRKVLSPDQMTAAAAKAIESFHAGVVDEIIETLPKHEWVIIGMRQNPVVKKARRFLEGKNLPYHYIEHGSYLSEWKKRLAIKLWSGWPTFPQVFHKGKLVGGAADLEKYLA